MKVTFVLPRFDLTGGNRVIAVYADGLRRRGHDVVVVAPRQREGLKHAVKRLVLHRGPRLPEASHFDGLSVEQLSVPHTAPVTDRDVPDADVVVATWWETAEWVAALTPRKGAKVHFMQDYEVWGGPKSRVDATCALPIPKIVIADWTYRLLTERFNNQPIALIPNSVDTQRFSAPPRNKQATPTVGLTYTPFRNKGTDISLEAVALARRQLPDLKLVAFGRTRPSRRLPLPAGTEYFEHVPDALLREIYARCDAWLFGTRIEGFGLPILEAMACRTPVIGTPGGAAPEILGEGGGVLVPHEDPRAMADAIVTLCTRDNSEWRGISERAYRTARRTTWDDATERFESALNLVGGGVASRQS